MAKEGKTPGFVIRNGVYYADWSHNGKRYRVSTHETTERAARKRRAAILEEFKKGATELQILRSVKNTLQKAALKRLPLAGAFDAFLDDVSVGDLAETTRNHYQGRFTAFVKWFELKVGDGLCVDDVSAQNARDFMADVRNGWDWRRGGFAAGRRREKTFNDYLAILRQTWKVFVKGGFAEDNPWNEIDNLPKDTHGKKPLDAGQLAALLKAATGEYHTLFVIGAYTGLRLKDCALMKWGNVDIAADWSAGFVSVVPAKTKRHSIAVDVPMKGPLLDELKRIGRRGDDEYIMPSVAAEYGPRLTDKITAIFADAGINTRIHEEGLKVAAVDYGFHSLRHTFVTRAVAQGVPAEVVRSMVGHTNAEMTRRYTHLTRADLSRGMENFSVDGGDDGGGSDDAGADPAAGRLDALRALLAEMDGDELKQAKEVFREFSRRR